MGLFVVFCSVCVEFSTLATLRSAALDVHSSVLAMRVRATSAATYRRFTAAYQWFVDMSTRSTADIVGELSQMAKRRPCYRIWLDRAHAG